MSKRIVMGGLVVIMVAAIVAALMVLRQPEEATGPIKVVPLDLEAATAGPDVAEAPGSVGEPAGEVTLFSISQEESRATFELDEDLRGRRQTVVGTTNQVAGEIGLDLADLSSAQVGVIRVNARTLVTDNDFRNRAINNQILDTAAYEFITFTPTSVEGLSGVVTIGESVDFTIVGDLLIRDISQNVTFLVEARADSADQISGRATAEVNRGDYGLNIPSVPNVANVDEVVKLSIEFVARSR